MSIIDGGIEIVARAAELADIESAVHSLVAGEGGYRGYVGDQLTRLPTRPPQRDWLASLTPRERDIAEPAGQALGSPAIATRLHVSVRTVDSHLGRIYRKLSVANRVALANLLNPLTPVESGAV